MNNYLYVILLEGCPFCLNTKRLLEEYKIKNQSIVIDHHQKAGYRTPEISTFPQIYFVKNDLKKKVLIGGNSDLVNLIDLSNQIKKDSKMMDQLIKEYLNSSTISKKILLKVLYLINNKNDLTGGSLLKPTNDLYINQKAGYDSELFNIYVADQLDKEILQGFLGKVIIIISGQKVDGIFLSYINKMEIYSISEYSIDMGNMVSLRANMVEWECHDVYCTMRRRSDVILSKEDLVNKFQNKDFIQFLVTKENYKFKNKEEQD